MKNVTEIRLPKGLNEEITKYYKELANRYNIPFVLIEN